VSDGQSGGDGRGRGGGGGSGGDVDLDGLTYEQLVAELESLTARMAAGDIGIEAAAELYERAGVLHAAAADRLARVQERIAKLAVTDPAD
jgi:exodeoxyribonuclease VII small subunit